METCKQHALSLFHIPYETWQPQMIPKCQLLLKVSMLLTGTKASLLYCVSVLLMLSLQHGNIVQAAQATCIQMLEQLSKTGEQLMSTGAR